MRISDWSSDVCSSDLRGRRIDDRAAACERAQPIIPFRQERSFEQLRRSLRVRILVEQAAGLCEAVDGERGLAEGCLLELPQRVGVAPRQRQGFLTPFFVCGGERSEEHTSELQSLMRISYAVFCLKKKTRIE